MLHHLSIEGSYTMVNCHLCPIVCHTLYSSLSLVYVCVFGCVCLCECEHHSLILTLPVRNCCQLVIPQKTASLSHIMFFNCDHKCRFPLFLLVFSRMYWDLLIIITRDIMKKSSQSHWMREMLYKFIIFFNEHLLFLTLTTLANWLLNYKKKKSLEILHGCFPLLHFRHFIKYQPHDCAVANQYVLPFFV